jgi:hypothetical protein
VTKPDSASPPRHKPRDPTIRWSVLLGGLLFLTACAGLATLTLASYEFLLRPLLASRQDLASLEQPAPISAATPTDQPRSYPTTISEVNTLNDFPLTIGSTWKYSHMEYREDQKKSGFVSVTVVGNQRIGGFFLAQLKVEQSFDPQWLPIGLGDGANEFWYAIDERGHVYYLPDLADVDMIEGSTLAYVFPLGLPDCWFRSADLWNAFGDHCTFSEGPQEYETPAGSFSDCFWIVTPYLSGNAQDWVCNGVGYAGAKYDHYGSPFGYETTLLEYKIASPE